MVHVGGGHFELFWQGLAIEMVFKNRFNTLIRTRPDGDGPLASGFQTVVAIAFTQAHDAQTGAEALLGISGAIPAIVTKARSLRSIFAVLATNHPVRR